VVARRARDRRDHLGRDARLRRENHREPVWAPGGDAALGGSAAKKHVQGGGPRHRCHHGGCRRRDLVAQHARGRAALRRACDLGGDRRFACRCGAQGAGVVLEPHRRAELGCKARRRDQFDQRPHRQEGRLYEPEVDHRNGDPHRAQARRPRRQGRYPSARRPGTGLNRAGAGRGRGRALKRSGAHRHSGQIQSAVLRPPILSEIHLAGCGDDQGVRGQEFADPAQDPQGPSPGGRVRLQQPRGGGAHLCQGV